MTTITAPTFEWLQLSPILIMLAAACIGVIIEAFVPRRHRFVTQLGVVEVAVLAAFVMLVVNWRAGNRGLLAMGSITLDGPTYILWGALLVFGLLGLMVFSERDLNNGATAFAASAASVPGSPVEAEATRARIEHTEIFPLGLFSIAGMMIFLSANDLLTMFVALEVFSLPLYLLSGMARR